MRARYLRQKHTFFVFFSFLKVTLQVIGESFVFKKVFHLQKDPPEMVIDEVAKKNNREYLERFVGHSPFIGPLFIELLFTSPEIFRLRPKLSEIKTSLRAIGF